MLFFTINMIGLIILLSVLSRKKKQRAAEEAKKQQSQQLLELEQASPAPAPREYTPVVSFEGSVPGHTVAPFTETAHIHQETSMTGFAPCPPRAEGSAGNAKVPAQSAPASVPLLSFGGQEAARGFLYSEILGKPKALQE